MLFESYFTIYGYDIGTIVKQFKYKLTRGSFTLNTRICHHSLLFHVNILEELLEKNGIQVNIKAIGSIRSYNY